MVHWPTTMHMSNILLKDHTVLLSSNSMFTDLEVADVSFEASLHPNSRERLALIEVHRIGMLTHT